MSSLHAVETFDMDIILSTNFIQSSIYLTQNNQNLGYDYDEHGYLSNQLEKIFLATDGLKDER